ncbi:MAG: hypothetical protein DRG76_10935 [Deltaproteobacteria bacterium]|nr:MAG: hypothetical protein DRG76_10935 [Deltaproteobacteria bacterium]
MKRNSTPPPDSHHIYCPKLGHLVHFAYCRRQGHGVPCEKIINCWYEVFLIEDYLRKTLSPSEWDSFLARRPKPKLTMLVELALKSQRHKPDRS